MAIESTPNIELTQDAYNNFLSLYDKIDQIFCLKNKGHNLGELYENGKKIKEEEIRKIKTIWYLFLNSPNYFTLFLTDNEEKEIFPTHQDKINYWITLVESITFLVEDKAFSNKMDSSLFDLVQHNILRFCDNSALIEEQFSNLKELAEKVKQLIPPENS